MLENRSEKPNISKNEDLILSYENSPGEVIEAEIDRIAQIIAIILHKYSKNHTE